VIPDCPICRREHCARPTDCRRELQARLSVVRPREYRVPVVLGELAFPPLPPEVYQAKYGERAA